MLEFMEERALDGTLLGTKEADEERELPGVAELGATLEVAPSHAPLSVQCCHWPEEVAGLFPWLQ
jgi:hypothetical protein